MRSRKKALVIRYGAYGDIIHCSPVIRALAEDGFEVTFEYNLKGRQLLAYHPYISHHRLFEPCSGENKDKPIEWLYERWDRIGKEYDKVVNFYHTLEYGMIAMEGTPEWDLPKEERHKRFNKNFYDHQLAVAGYPHITGRVGEIFYPEYEHQIVKKYLAKFEGKFVLLYNLAGTGLHKVYPFAQSLFNEFLVRHKNVIIITTGDVTCQRLEWVHPRVVNKAGRIPFRQALLLSKYVNCVVGCETGLLCGAGMWGTPKVHLLTAASKENLTKYDENDYSLESPAECAPCHKGPYKYIGCPFDKSFNLPVCVFHKRERVLSQIEKIYERWADERARDSVSVGDVVVNIFERKPCPLCGGKRDAKVVVNGDYNYYHCSKCGIAFTEWENIRMDTYDSVYHLKYQGDISRKAYQYTYSKIMPLVRVNLNGATYPKNFLDIGCVNKTILDRAKDDGFTTYGMDINKHSSPKEPHRFILGNFEDVKVDTKFLVIWASHIFEHFRFPIEALKKLYSILYPTGVAFISMPDIESVDWQHPEVFPHWTPTEHHILWERKAFEREAEKAGFVVRYSVNNQDRNFICWGDMHVILQKV